MAVWPVQAAKVGSATLVSPAVTIRFIIMNASAVDRTLSTFILPLLSWKLSWSLWCCLNCLTIFISPVFIFVKPHANAKWSTGLHPDSHAVLHWHRLIVHDKFPKSGNFCHFEVVHSWARSQWSRSVYLGFLVPEICCICRTSWIDVARMLGAAVCLRRLRKAETKENNNGKRR